MKFQQNLWSNLWDTWDIQFMVLWKHKVLSQINTAKKFTVTFYESLSYRISTACLKWIVECMTLHESCFLLDQYD
jgi:hypothetical protein